MNDEWILMNDFEILKANCYAKKRFIVFKEYEDFLNFWNKFEIKTKEDYYDLYLQNVTFYYLVMCLKNLEIIA